MELSVTIQKIRTLSVSWKVIEYEQEVLAIAREIGNQTNETIIKQQLSKARIIHLATHGLSNSLF